MLRRSLVVSFLLLGCGEVQAGGPKVHVVIGPQAPKLEDIKLVDYDFAKYGASAERKRIIERWEKEVGSQPK